MNCEVSNTADDDDDADDHFCLKCKAVVRGLENYVQHRKLGCCTAPAQVSVSCLTIRTSYSDGTGLTVARAATPTPPGRLSNITVLTLSDSDSGYEARDCSYQVRVAIWRPRWPTAEI